MKKPVDALDWLKYHHATELPNWARQIVDWAATIPDDGYVCKWPKSWPKDRLMETQSALCRIVTHETATAAIALRAMASIAPDPKPKKRMVNLWRYNYSEVLHERTPDWEPRSIGWSKVAGPIEIDVVEE